MCIRDREMGVTLDTEFDAKALKDVVEKYKALVEKKTGSTFPDDPKQQLNMARDAVFGSWMNPRAITYRKLHNIPAEWGTAVNVQAMVYGNMGDDSNSGVALREIPAPVNGNTSESICRTPKVKTWLQGSELPFPLTT